MQEWEEPEGPEEAGGGGGGRRVILPMMFKEISTE